MRYTVTLALLLFSFFPILSAAPLVLNSGTDKIHLMELYTSEGCSSCPPAERYLNSYSKNPQLWKKIIPLAFHVDYWDYLGWQDRFARPEHSARQRRYARLQRNRTVYTPAFFIDGQSWRPGLFRYGMPDLKTLKTGRLKLQIDAQGITADFIPETPVTQAYRLNIALLGMGLKTRITAGENEGRHARHDFVVLGLNHSGSTRAEWKMQLPAMNPRIQRNDVERFAIAAWVSTLKQPFPLQSVGAYLPDSYIRPTTP